MKNCKKCNKEKHKEEFSRNIRAKDGLNSECKSCNSEYYYANQERVRSAAAIYRRDNQEKIKSLSKSYYSDNRKAILAANAAWASLNREKVNSVIAAWALSNPEKVKAARHNRRARELMSEGRHAASDIRRIFDNQLGLCANCKTRLFRSGKQKYHVDHIMPLALGGSNWPSNLQCLCPPCNLSKGAKHPDQWAKEHGRLL